MRRAKGLITLSEAVKRQGQSSGWILPCEIEMAGSKVSDAIHWLFPVQSQRWRDGYKMPEFHSLLR